MSLELNVAKSIFADSLIFRYIIWILLNVEMQFKNKDLNCKDKNENLHKIYDRDKSNVSSYTFH